jgi:hypothetical protein
MAHSKEAHATKAAMPQFKEGHWEHKPGEHNMSDVKYTKGEMNNPEHLKQSVASLNGYVNKHKAQH